MAYQAIGVAKIIAIQTRLKKSFDNKAIMLEEEAPSTLRTPISFSRRSAAKAASPNRPKQEIKDSQ